MASCSPYLKMQGEGLYSPMTALSDALTCTVARRSRLPTLAFVHSIDMGISQGGSVAYNQRLAPQTNLSRVRNGAKRPLGTLGTAMKQGWEVESIKGFPEDSPREVGLKGPRFFTSRENKLGWRVKVFTDVEKAAVGGSENSSDNGSVGAGQGLNFADILNSISNLYTEVGEDSRQAAEYLQDMEVEDNGRSTADYNRRAYNFGRSAEILAARKKKGERVLENLELLEEVVMEEDTGRTPADYRRRADIFSKSAEVFAAERERALGE